MADWYAAAAAGPRDQLMSLHGFESAAMLGYGPNPFPGLQPHEAYGHPHAHSHVQAAQQAAQAAAAYTLQRQQQQNFCFGDQQWRHPDGSIMELRKEKSRDAARSRRGKENYEFFELAKMLPLPQAITTQLDKASVIRLTLSYLKLREFTMHGDPPWTRLCASSKTYKGLRGRNPSCSPLHMELFDLHQGTHILQSLDGFAFTLAADGRFLYISETVSIYLGLSQVEMAGSSVFEYVHAEDHQELADQLELTLATGQSAPSPSSLASDDNSTPGDQGTMNPDVATSMTLDNNSNFSGYERGFCIRMKSTLTKRGCHFKSSGYRCVLIMGHLRPQYVFSHTPRKTPPTLLGMVGLAIALPPPTVHELRLESDMFVTRLNFDFRIAHCEPKVHELLDYSAEELQGRSLYSLCHGQDANLLRKAHTDLLKKGQVMSPYYRLLNKTGGYVLMQLCATIICNSKTGEEQSIIAINYVLRAEAAGTILDCSQMPQSLATSSSDMETDANGNDKGATNASSEYDSPDRTCPGLQGERCSTDTHGPLKLPGGHVDPINKEVRPLDIVNDNSSTPISLGPPTPCNTATPPPNSPLTPNTHRPATHSPTKDTSPPIVLPNTCPNTNPRYSPHATTHPPHATTHHPHTSQYPPGDKIASHHDLGGSVRHLEAAMTRHLPQDGGIGSIGGGTFPTIQWAGGQEPTSTAILRQLYAAKRETVIRTSRDTLDPSHPSVSNPSVAPAHSAPVPSSGLLTHTPTYPGYHISPPSSVSPERLKAHPCDPYTDLYPPLYSAPTGPPKNPYDALRSPWYPA